MNHIILYLVLTLAIIQNGNSLTTGKSEKEDQQCGQYTYRVVKPLIDYIRQLKDEIEKSEYKDKLINDQSKKLFQQEDNERSIKDLRNQTIFQQRTIDSLKKELVDNTDKLEVCKIKLTTLNDSLLKKDKAIDSLNHKVENLNITNLKLKDNEYILLNTVQELQLNLTKVYNIPNSCIPYGNSSGVYKIALPGMNAFDVQCDSQIVGPGWIVIFQYINTDFNWDWDWDWTSYREGFGTFDGNYFLGLEKIHRLTSSRRYELFIKIEYYYDSIEYIRYDNFEVANEKADYTLSSLGEMSLSEIDTLRPYEHNKFSTLDRDNVVSDDNNCAKKSGVGWWYADCSNILFGKDSIINRAMMLIRPKE